MAKRRSLLRALHFTAGLCIVFIAAVAATLPAFAQSLPNAPDAPGSIAGTVTAAGGAPLAGIEVRIYRLTSLGSWSEMRLHRTDAQGNYKATALAAGMYSVGFSDPAKQFGQSFYPDALTLGGVTTLAVAGIDVVGIDAVLQPAGAVQGIYNDTHWSEYDYTYLSALVSEGGAWYLAAQTVVDATGPYSLTGLASGVYRICAFDAWSENAVTTPVICYNDIVSSPDYAQPVTVTGGITTTGIDLNAGVDGDGATIGGLVRGAGGAPLTNIRVWLESRSQPPIRYVNPTLTNSSGQYEVRGLPPGDYALRFVDEGAGTYQTQYYNGAICSEQATIVGVGRFEERLDVDVVLAPGGVLSGTVLVLGEHPEHAIVIAEPSDLTPPAYPPYTITEYRNGAYRFAGLRPGRYRLTANGGLDGIQFSGSYSGSAADAEGFVTVAPGAIIGGLDVNLGAGVYDGEISGRVMAAGTPLAGIGVSAYRYADDAPIEVESGPPIVTVATDAQGRYTIGGLPAGIYRIGFSDPAGIYATQYYSNSMNKTQAERLNLDPVRQIANIGATLARAGSLSGRVLLDNDAPGSFHTIQVYYEIPESDHAVLLELSIDVNTDASGDYSVQGLLPGRYRVCAETRSGTAFMAGCYGGPLLINSPWMGKEVPVRVGEDTTGIDIYLVTSLPEHSYLPVMAR